jgi:hypothetical protein
VRFVYNSWMEGGIDLRVEAEGVESDGRPRRKRGGTVRSQRPVRIGFTVAICS